MAQKVFREQTPGCLLQAKLGRYGLQFLNEGVRRAVAENVLCPVIDEADITGQSGIQSPSTDVAGCIKKVSSKPTSNRMPSLIPGKLMVLTG